MKMQDTYRDGQRYISERGSYKVTIVAVEYKREATEAEQRLFGTGALEISYGFFEVCKDGLTPDKRKKVAAPHESYFTYKLVK